jgi:hypothetical protein
MKRSTISAACGDNVTVVLRVLGGAGVALLVILALCFAAIRRDIATDALIEDMMYSLIEKCKNAAFDANRYEITSHGRFLCNIENWGMAHWKYRR